MCAQASSQELYFPNNAETTRGICSVTSIVRPLFARERIPWPETLMGFFLRLASRGRLLYLGGITHTATWDAGLGEEEVYHLS